MDGATQRVSEYIRHKGFNLSDISRKTHIPYLLFSVPGRLQHSLWVDSGKELPAGSRNTGRKAAGRPFR